MGGSLALDPTTVAVVLGMAAVTYLTKIGGLAVVCRIDLPERAERALRVLPGTIVVAILVPELLEGGSPEWLAAGVVAVVAWRTDNLPLALGAGLVAVVVLRSLLPVE